MQKNTWQKIKDLFDYPGTMGVGMTLLEIAILAVIFCFNRKADTYTHSPIVNDPYEWIYGTWDCNTPDGTIVLVIRNDGRLYNSIDEIWHDYSINNKEIVEKCNGYISTYRIDKLNKRFDCGKSGVWFHKLSSSTELTEAFIKPAESNKSIRFYHESDIHNYLRNHKFVNEKGDISIAEGDGMVLVANGTILTGAINIQQFSSNQAYFTAYAPIDGTTFQFVVNCKNGTLYCDNDGTMYYIK